MICTLNMQKNNLFINVIQNNNDDYFVHVSMITYVTFKNNDYREMSYDLNKQTNNLICFYSIENNNEIKMLINLLFI